MSLTGVLVLASQNTEPQAARNRPRATALAHVANRPIVHHVLDALTGAGVDELVTVINEPDRAEVRECISGYGGSVVKSVRHVDADAVDLATGLRLAAELVGSAASIVHLGDGLVGESLARCVSQSRTGSADFSLLVHRRANGGERLTDTSRRALRLAELDPTRTAFGVAGVCLLGPGVLSRIAALPAAPGDDSGLASLAERLVADGGELQIQLVDVWRRYAGAAADLLELNRIALDLLPPSANQPMQDGNLIEGRVQIDHTAQIRTSVIVGPVIIGPGAQIADAYIGPFTSIGERVCIEGAEIERSILFPGSSVMHVGGRLVASVVGRDARVFRDFSLPRAMRLLVGDGDEVALC